MTHLNALGTILDPGKVIFGHFIDFGHFPIEIPIEAEKFSGQQKERSYIKNKTCFENRRPNGTTWNHVKVEIQNFIKIRITLVPVRDIHLAQTQGLGFNGVAFSRKYYFEKC